eukprot:g16048.t1
MELKYQDAGRTVTTTIGDYVEGLLGKEKYFNRPLPRVPVKVKQQLERELAPISQYRKRMEAHMKHNIKKIAGTPVEVFHDGQWVPGTAQDFTGKHVKGRKVRVELDNGQEVNVHMGKVVLRDDGSKTEDNTHTQTLEETRHIKACANRDVFCVQEEEEEEDQSEPQQTKIQEPIFRLVPLQRQSRQRPVRGLAGKGQRRSSLFLCKDLLSKPDKESGGEFRSRARQEEEEEHKRRMRDIYEKYGMSKAAPSNYAAGASLLPKRPWATLSLAQAPWHQQGLLQDAGGLLTKAAPAQGPLSGCPGPQLVNTLSIPEYRQRIVEIYSIHKPDNVIRVDYLLEKYKGNEEFLYRSICQKFATESTCSFGFSYMEPQVRCGHLVSTISSVSTTSHLATSEADAATFAPATSTAMWRTCIWIFRPEALQPAAKTKAKSQFLVDRHGPIPAGGGLFVGGATRPGIGYQAPAASPPAPKQKHEVMEWDPATGQMVATTIEIETGDLHQAAPSSVPVVPAPVVPEMKVAPPPVVMPACATLQEAGSLMPPAAKAALVTPTTSQPAEVQMQALAGAGGMLHVDPGTSAASRVIEIDTLLLGERSGFFEALGTPKVDEPSCDMPAWVEQWQTGRIQILRAGSAKAVPDASADQAMPPGEATEVDASMPGELEGQAASFDPYLASAEADEAGGDAGDEKKDAAATANALADAFQ